MNSSSRIGRATSLLAATRSSVRGGLLVFALGLGVVASQARAQASRDTVSMVPRELVEGLMRPLIGGFPGSAEFHVGTLPPAIQPFLFVPAGARILGALSTMSSTYVVMVSSLSPAEITTEYRQEQPRLGWTFPPTIAETRGWGFVPAQNASRDGAGLEFCHVGQSLLVSPMPAPNGTTQILATVQNFGGRCQSANRAMYGGRRPPATAFPTLENPAGVPMNSQACTMVRGIGGPAGATTSTTERLQTSMTASQLLEVFGKQLADSGWKSLESGTAVERRSWTHADSGNVSREATLQLTPSTNSMTHAQCVDVILSVRATQHTP